MREVRCLVPRARWHPADGLRKVGRRCWRCPRGRWGWGAGSAARLFTLTAPHPSSWAGCGGEDCYLLPWQQLLNQKEGMTFIRRRGWSRHGVITVCLRRLLSGERRNSSLRSAAAAGRPGRPGGVTAAAPRPRGLSPRPSILRARASSAPASVAGSSPGPSAGGKCSWSRGLQRALPRAFGEITGLCEGLVNAGEG